MGLIVKHQGDWRLPIGECRWKLGPQLIRYSTEAVATDSIANFQLPIFDWNPWPKANWQSPIFSGGYRSRTVPTNQQQKAAGR
jgi:hypothetical protein